MSEHATPVMLRPHHVLCALLFIALGQTPESTEATKIAVELIHAGTPIQIVAGPGSEQQDVICKTLCPKTTERYHCTHPKFEERDKAALVDLSEMLQEPLIIGSVITLTQNKIDRLRNAFAQNAGRGGCNKCFYYDFCTATAKAGFGDTLFSKLQAA